MTTKPADRCLACGQNERQPLLGGALLQCRGCGFARTVPIDGPSASDAELYSSEYFESDNYRRYFDRAEQWRFEARRRLRWLLSATRPATLLEIGAAGGFFLEAARSAGIAVRGVEISEACARYAVDRLGLDVHHGPFESAPLGDPVDVLCAFHVLEHVEDPRDFLDRARSAVAPGGWLALEVPNIASASFRRQGLAWPDLALKYHRSHFTPSALRELLHGCGFSVRRSETIMRRHYVSRRRALVLPMLLGDWCASGSARVCQPRSGDFLRVIAQAPAQSGRRS